jgi:hypothetical protein
MRTISDLSRDYEVSRAAVAAVLDEHDVSIHWIGPSKCVRDEDLAPVVPVLEKLRSKNRARRRSAVAV